MSIKFTHATNFNVGELENRNKGEPFIVVLKRSYLEFCLFLHPNVKKEKFEGVFIGIDSMNEHKSLKIDYSFAILLPDGSSHQINDWDEDRSLDGYGSGFFCDEPIASNLSELKSKDLLMDGNTTLCVAVEMEIDQSFFDIGEDMEKKFSAQKFSDFKDGGFWSRVYAKMMEGEHCANYKILCTKNKEQFPMHKVLARERSFYFENLFRSHPSFEQEKSHGVDWSSAVIEEVRFFLYNDKASEKFAAVPLEELAQVAKMLGLYKLLAICEKNFMDQICKDNAWDFLTIADTLQLQFLKKKALCTVTEDPNVIGVLMDEQKKKELREEMGEFLLKRGRAQFLVQ